MLAIGSSLRKVRLMAASGMGIALGMLAAVAPAAVLAAGMGSAGGSVVAAQQKPTTRPAADTPSATATGNTFTIPAGWSVKVKGNASILEAPEANSWIALVDVKAQQHDAAIAEAWAAYRPTMRLPLLATASSPDKGGWTEQRIYSYQTPPKEHRSVTAGAMRHGERWIAWISDIDNAVREKRLAAISLVFDSLLPKGYTPESFAGRKANALDARRIQELSEFVERARRESGVPGLSVGIVQSGKTVLAGGFGRKELGKAGQPDADTLYLIASTTKPLTTLMLAKLVDAKRVAWDTPVIQVLPSFRLGDAGVTRKVQIKHLICACTGLPRQDLEWLMEFKDATPASSIASLGTMLPTSGFGEIFQYSNLLAAVAGFTGGHVLLPDKELGAAYDQAMQSLVFDPLGMRGTTFDFKRALAANHAAAHALDIDGKPSHAVFDVNYAIVPVRPAGGAWSSVNDLLKYVAMELANGRLADGSRYISAQILNDRRKPNVPVGKDNDYGMGLMMYKKAGVRIVGHAGSMFGYRSQMFWLPDHDVGVVMLTNSDQGWTVTGAVERKLFELMFDGKPQADNELRMAVAAMREDIAAGRKLLRVPPEHAALAKLADNYTNPALGDIAVRRTGESVIFDFGEWKSEVASRDNPDGTTSFITIVPGFIGHEFMLGEMDGRSVLSMRDAQHEYLFREK